jgi:hypothetical protein
MPCWGDEMNFDRGKSGQKTDIYGTNGLIRPEETDKLHEIGDLFFVHAGYLSRIIVNFKICKSSTVFAY